MKPNPYLTTLAVIAGAISLVGIIVAFRQFTEYTPDPAVIGIGFAIAVGAWPIWLVPAAIAHALADVHDRLPRKKPGLS